MIRKKKRFVRPKKAFESARIKEENVLLERYGLKNKREIWKTIAKVNYFRRRAKALAKETREEQEVLFKKLQQLGLKTNTLADVLALNVENLLKRRLQTVVVDKSIAKTMKHARQMIVHKKILINGKAVNTPSYLVSIDEEKQISARESKAKNQPIEEKADETEKANTEQTGEEQNA